MRQNVLILFILGLLTMSTAALADAVTYTIDPAHTSFSFVVQHMMISNVPGGFDQFSGTITYDPADLTKAKADIVIQTASIDTRIQKRDDHLRSPDFFDAAKYPTITFNNALFTPGHITGDLTMKGKTQRVTIPVIISGPVDEMGHQAIGITGSLTINRQDFGISFNKVLDKGGVAVSNDVNISISIEADQK